MVITIILWMLIFLMNWGCQFTQIECMIRGKVKNWKTRGVGVDLSH